MNENWDEEEQLRSVPLQTAQSILRARQRAEEELVSNKESLWKQSEWLRVTLASIGDAVIATDTDGRITRAYGVQWPIFNKARRVTFVVGPTQHIEAVFWHEIQVNRHLDDVVAFLKKAPSHRAKSD